MCFELKSFTYLVQEVLILLCDLHSMSWFCIVSSQLSPFIVTGGYIYKIGITFQISVYVVYLAMLMPSSSICEMLT